MTRSGKPSRLKLVRPRMANVRGRVRMIEMEDELHFSPDLLERKALYQTDRWLDLRARKLEKRCAVCGAYARNLDHFLGHDDDQATRVALRLGIPAAGDWRVRFWQGPFMSLCVSCHSTKTRMERDGRLMMWVDGLEERRAALRRERAE